MSEYDILRSSIDVPNVPEIPEPHWKVGDGMVLPGDRGRFVIGQIAYVDHGGDVYGVRFYDTAGVEQGEIKLRRIVR